MIAPKTRPAGGRPRRHRRRNAFGLIQEYCAAERRLRLKPKFFILRRIMKSSKFAILSFVISLLVFIQAIIALIDLLETHPFVGFLFPLVLLIYLPDYPLGYLPQLLGFPIVLPLLTIVFAKISLRKGENKKILAIVSIALVLVSLLLYVAIRFLQVISNF